jgi:hypothetical protein
LWKTVSEKCASINGMGKKLSKKEEGEVVTKGYLRDYLDEVLESKNYITKDYFEERLESTINKALEKQSKDFYQHMDALIEQQLHSLQTFMETMDDRYVLRKEWLMYKRS